MTPPKPHVSIPLSALEHYAYCPRQAGLILLEDGYTENSDTARGTSAHHRVDEPDAESRRGVRVFHSFPVYSERLGLHGVADVVEMVGGGVAPVEYKVGPYIPGGPADLQAAGQAMCLQEMFRVAVPVAQVYSVTERRRHPVAVDAALQRRVMDAAAVIRGLLLSEQLPGAVDDARCPRCSLNPVCVPAVIAHPRRVKAALADLFKLDPS